MEVSHPTGGAGPSRTHPVGENEVALRVQAVERARQQPPVLQLDLRAAAGAGVVRQRRFPSPPRGTRHSAGRARPHGTGGRLAGAAGGTSGKWRRTPSPRHDHRPSGERSRGAAGRGGGAHLHPAVEQGLGGFHLRPGLRGGTPGPPRGRRRHAGGRGAGRPAGAGRPRCTSGRRRGTVGKGGGLGLLLLPIAARGVESEIGSRLRAARGPRSARNLSQNARRRPRVRVTRRRNRPGPLAPSRPAIARCCSTGAPPRGLASRLTPRRPRSPGAGAAPRSPPAPAR